MLDTAKEKINETQEVSVETSQTFKMQREKKMKKTEYFRTAE